jgi:Zn-dependent protease with chaperone function
MIVTGVVTSALGFWICDRLLMAYVGTATTHHNLPIWTLPLLMLLITLLSILAEPFQNIVMRRYERQCDRYALERTGLRAAYISAFSKLARLNKADPAPHPIAVFLLHSHPPIAERIAAADR